VGRVIIGVDPHKLSATIEVLDRRENGLGGGRFGTDRDGYRQMLTVGRRCPDRVWAVGGAHGIGRHLAQRLVTDGEQVLDVPAKLSARARVFSTGHGRKTDATDAHSIAVVAVRTTNLASVSVEDELVALRLLADRCDELAGARTRTVSRLHRLLLELIPGGAPRFLSATQAKALLATVRPRDVAGHTRRQLAAELLADIVRLDRQLKDSDQRLKEAVAATGSGLPDLYGIGLVGAARILGDVGNIARFASKARFASWTGTAPIDASSGQQQRIRWRSQGRQYLFQLGQGPHRGLLDAGDRTAGGRAQAHRDGFVVVEQQWRQIRAGTKPVAGGARRSACRSPRALGHALPRGRPGRALPGLRSTRSRPPPPGYPGLPRRHRRWPAGTGPAEARTRPEAAVPLSGTAASPVGHRRGSQWLAVTLAWAAVSKGPSPVAPASGRFRRRMCRFVVRLRLSQALTQNV
jgi:hypothetical protein